MNLQVNLTKIIEQAIPQIFGSDERDLLQQFLDRCTDDPLVVDIDFANVVFYDLPEADRQAIIQTARTVHKVAGSNTPLSDAFSDLADQIEPDPDEEREIERELIEAGLAEEDESSALHWLWPDWIPRRTLTILAHRPDYHHFLQAQYLAKNLIRRRLAGGEWPDGVQTQSDSRYLYAYAEYKSLGYWARLPLYAEGRLMIFGPHQLNDCAARRDFTSRCLQHRPDLIIVENPLANEASDSLITVTILNQLDALARELGCAVLLICPTQKMLPGEPITPHSLAGPTALAATARSIISMTPLGDTRVQLDLIKPAFTFVDTAYLTPVTVDLFN